MGNPIPGCTLKFDKAKRDFRAVQAEIGQFIESDPVRVLTEFESDTGRTVFRAQVVNEPPQRWMIEVGTIAYQLRSALDHLVYHLARLGPDSPGDRTGFPIFDKPGKFTHHARELLRGVPPEHQATIEGLQPYQPGQETLGWLDPLGKADKHNDLVGIKYASGDIGIMTLVDPATFKGPMQVSVGVEGGRIEDGTVLGWQSGWGDQGHMPVDAKFSIAIAFGEGDRTILDVRTLAIHVAGIVERFRPIFE